MPTLPRPALPRLAAAATVVVAALVGTLGPARPAAAHPLGAPATALLERTAPATVAVTWTPNPDDLAVLARHLGLDPVDDRGLRPEESRRLARSDAFADHVAAGIRGHQAGVPCRSRVEPAATAENTTVTVTCPLALDEAPATLTVTLLTDLDERYTTLALAPGAVRDTEVLFTAATPTHGLEVRAGDLAVVERAADAGAGPAAETLGGAPSRETSLVALVQDPGRLGAVGLAAALALAAAVGAAHALAPGHGKAVAAAYLVGDRGRPRHALALGVVVAGMHSLSTLVLGVALWRARADVDLSRLSSGLRTAGGAVVLTIGLVLLRRRWREHRRRRDHARAHEDGHDHDHGHDHVAPLTRGGLAALAVSGGLLPSPTGVLVVVGALTVGRLALGITLVAAFSVGLAATVTATGLVALAGRDLVRRGARSRIEAASTWLPVVGAGAVAAAGVVLLATAR